jgi:hypothetical protein
VIWAGVLAMAVVAGIVGGVVGFGSTILLTPVLVAAIGPKETVPVLAISALLANVSRAGVWWREIEWRVVGVFATGAIPGAAAGARLLVALDPRFVEAALGAFLILIIAARRWLLAAMPPPRLWHMGLVGLVIGFLSGLVATTGPINTPFFLLYGLTKGAFLSTEAASSIAIALSKSATFRLFGLLRDETLMLGLIVGSAVMVGSWISKRLVERMEVEVFRHLIEAVTLAAGVWMLLSAINH